VRAKLDETTEGDERRWLGARVPAYVAAHGALGIDLAALAEAGVDVVTLSYYFFTEQLGDYAQIRRSVPGASLYVEMTPMTRAAAPVTDETAYANYAFRRTEPDELYSTAHLAYSRGCDGVCLADMAYYREHGAEGRGPWAEPPFEAFSHLGDAEWLARQDQVYFLGEVWNAPPLPGRQLPRHFEEGTTQSFRLSMCPTERGWRSDGRLRVQTAKPIAHGYWTAEVNGERLKDTADRSEPCDPVYPNLVGTAEEHLAWTVPALAVRNGMNEVTLTMHGGEPADVVWLDLVMAEELR
jgi:hypothetical protein